MAQNAILQHKSLTILQQIEELKNWHKEQQSKLNLGNQIDRNNVTDNKLETVRDGGTKHSATTQLQQSKPNLSSVLNIDEIPIKVTNPNFNKIIENNISPHEPQVSDTHQNGEKPKFRFLKKGEGIARFRMRPKKIAKPAKNYNTLQLTKNTNTFEDITSQSGKLQKPQSKMEEYLEEEVELIPPNLKLNFKNWKSIFSSGKAEEIIEKVIDNNQLDLFQPNSSIDSSTASIMEKLIAVGRKQLKEREELHAFETVEQHVLDSSFCSTSSYVARLMENAVISTPVKKAFPNHNTLATKTLPNQEPAAVEVESAPQKIAEQNRAPTPVWENPEIAQLGVKTKDVVNTEDLEHSLHVRFAEEVDYKSFVEQSQSFANSDSKDKNDVKEFNESEEWKEDSGEDSSCCSHCNTPYSSSDEDVRSISPPVRLPSGVQNHSMYQCNAPKHRTSPVGELAGANQMTNNSQRVETPCTKGMDEFAPILSEKLKELEDEIEIFRKENNKLKGIRENLEKEQKKFQKEKKKFLTEIEEEQKKNAAKLEEDKQKLAKEKLIFEKYSKSLSKNPTKEERKEIQALREQLSEMKEELNRKESRWGAAQARVRNQVKHLEEDNRKLREEVETLRKQARHLEFLTQKKRGKSFNNTKLIHAINDHISNIDAECDGKSIQGFTGVGYFQPKSDYAKTGTVSEADLKSMNTIKVLKEGASGTKSSAVFNATNKLIDPTQKQVTVSKEVTKEHTNKPSPEHIKFREEINSSNKDELREERLQDRNDGKIPDTVFTLHDQSPGVIKETVNEDGTVEKLYPDGRKETVYKNGNVKKYDPITGSEKTIYFNGDVKEIKKDGTVKYYFSESRIWHMTLPDGLEVLDFPSGQVERRHTNGMVEIVYPNDCKKLSYPDGIEEIYYADGTTLRIEADKRKILSLPNGQKEIHTDECIRREYPDGTVKIVYPDGVTETIYANGRVRLKDKHGNLVMDSGTVDGRL